MVDIKVINKRKKILSDFGIEKDVIEENFHNVTFKSLRQLDCLSDSLIRINSPQTGETILNIIFLSSKLSEVQLSQKLNFEPGLIKLVKRKYELINKTLDELCDISDIEIEELFYPELKKHRNMAVKYN